MKSIDLLNAFKRSGIDLVTGVPDSLQKEFCSLVSSEASMVKHVAATNEGSAIGLAIGHHMATGSASLVYMQNSGLGNAFYPLISLAHSAIYKIPMILMIGWRGMPGRNDEPQHQLKGKITPLILRLLNIKFLILNNLKDKKKIKDLINYSKEKKKPIAFLIKNSTLSLKKNYKKYYKSKYFLTREFVINELLSKISRNTRIVSTTGFTSRELFQIRRDNKFKNGKDFYMVGGMGHSSMMALGYSLGSNNEVICLDGDGSLIMHMGSLISTGFNSKKNFKHILLNNGSHESVGDQKIDTLKVNFKDISLAFGYKKYYLAEDSSSLKINLKKFLKSKGPSFFEVRIKSGNINNLSRPKDLIKIKKIFIQKL